MRTVLAIFILLAPCLSSAQPSSFPFGKVTYRELEMASYDKDTSAIAVVLNETGEAYIENSDNYNLIFKHHLKIKILKKGGLKYGDFEILLRKNDKSSEILRSVKASTFNTDNGPITEVKLNAKNIFTENKSKYGDLKKFALKYSFENVDDFTKPMVVNMQIEINAYSGVNNFLLNPFFIDRWDANPFQSSERLYPVDFGAPMEEIVIFNLEYPDSYLIDELPADLGLALPNAGGRYLFKMQNTGNTLTMNSSLLINKTVFTSDEYHYLKELFSRVVSTQQTDLVFKTKL